MSARTVTTDSLIDPVAYSYVRFSHPDQAKGDSLRRQTEASAAWCERNGVRLDACLSLRDLGVSAFKGAHRTGDKHDLAQFLRAVDQGRVRPGSYLIIENLDRLSREDERTALRVWMDLLDRKINIVQLRPETVFRHEKSDMMDIMRAIIELSRGHSESARKSERVGDAWAEKKRRVRDGEPQVATKRMGEGRTILTRRLPGWVREVEGKLVPDRAGKATVRRVYALRWQGLGAAAIAKVLNQEGVPVLGRKRFRGRPVVWNETVVYHLLTTETVTGRYQPCKGRGSDRQPVGKSVEGYYPRVIEDREYYAMQDHLAALATVGKGRRGSHTNLLAGLLQDARDGGSLTYKHHGTRPPVLIPVGAKHGRGTAWSSFPADVLETALLSLLREVKAKDVWANGTAAGKVEELSGRLAEAENLVAVWTARMDDPNLVDVVAPKLAEFNGRRKELAEALEKAQREAASPLSECWGQFRSVAELLAKDRSDELRLKVRAALRRAVESVCCLFVRRGGLRLAAVQVHFRKSDRVRSYLIVCEQRRANGHQVSRPARWRARSLAEAGHAGDLDLRDPAHAASLEAWLLALDPARLRQLLRPGA
jgi:DNA invertase Pin-like site-specific DNA recombinase